MTKVRVQASHSYLEIHFTAENETVSLSPISFDDQLFIFPEHAQEFWSEGEFKNVEKDQAFSRA